MRLFIALKLPDIILQEIARVQAELKRAGVTGRYTPVEHMHITLLFLGEQESDIREALHTHIKETLASFTPLEMEITGLGSFMLPPRLMFCHFDTTPYHAFDNLAYAIRDIPEKSNIALPESVLEKPPLAHATFLRMKKGQDSRPLKRLAKLHHQKWEFEKASKIAPASLSFQANQISLIQSTLTEQGPTYTVIKDYRLT